MAALVLWDVDHTLVENAGVSKETYAAAFQRFAGFEPRTDVRTDGRTDKRIMRDLFAAHGLTVPDWTEVNAALAAAGAERFAEMRARGSVLVGAAEAIAALAAISGVVQSVLTGNIEPNARMKLSALGLGNLVDFSVGAYGSDDDDRAALVALAQQRASAAYNQHFGPQNTVLVGDTPRDVDAGLRGGAQVIAVATGVDSMDELRRAGDVLVLPDLADTAGFVAEVARLSA